MGFTRINQELSLRERCALAPVTSTTTLRPTPPRSGYFNQNAAVPKQSSTTSTLLLENGASQGNNQVLPNCLFCGYKHFSASCKTVSDPTARKKILREKRRCFHISYFIFIFHILNIFIQGTNSIRILFYNLALLKLKYLINYLQIN